MEDKGPLESVTIYFLSGQVEEIKGDVRDIKKQMGSILIELAKLPCTSNKKQMDRVEVEVAKLANGHCYLKEKVHSKLDWKAWTVAIIFAITSAALGLQKLL